jgi:D-serine deaminase-like pyridoxal phosphate-dependent protein
MTLPGEEAPLAATVDFDVGDLLASARLNEVPTPFLVVDQPTLERNLAAMQNAFGGRSASLRPHVKTHKCTAIARLQVAAGAVGVTCSTTDEVAAMAAAGIGDVLLGNVVTDRQRLRSLAASATVARVAVAVDSEEAVSLLAAAAAAVGALVGAVVEIDIGMARNGVASVADGIALAETIAATPALELRGVMAYEGHLVDTADRAERGELAVRAFEPALELLHELRARGLEAPILTGGATATHDSTGALPEMTDVQAGTYALMDATYRKLAPEFEPAAVVVATVLTSRADGPLVLNLGQKRLGSDWGHPEIVGYEARHLYTAEEHCVFQHAGGPRPRVGERVALLPPHICTTMGLYREAFAWRDGEVADGFAIDARDPLA